MESKTDNSTIPEELQRRYSNFRVLGSGAMGAVYRAHDSNLDKDVAIKLLKQRQIEPDVAIRFQQEAKLASKLKHHNLVTLMDFGISEKGEPYIIMESVEGTSLSSLLDDHGALSLPAAVNMLVQICDGMEHAHRNGVVHRDLKPSNVIVCGENLNQASIKVLDFGIAKLDDTSGNITRTGTILGTPYYMSPEQFSGENVDRRTDIYSAGSMLFRMLTNCHPFEADTMLEIMREKRTTVAPLMTDVAKEVDIPDHIEDVVAKCLEQDPEMRYQSMTEFKEALFIAMERSHVAVQAPPVEQEKVVKLEVKKIPKWVFAIFGVLVCVLVSIGFFSMNVINSRPEKPSKNKNAYKTPHEQGIYNYPISDKDDQHFNSVFEVNRPKKSWHAVGEVQDSDLEHLVTHEHADVAELYLGNSSDLTTRQDKITKEGWVAIGKLPLRRLGVPYSLIADEDVKNFAKMPYLNYLDLGKTAVGDKAMTYLENNDSIKELSIFGTSVTDEGIKSIATIKRLSRLNLDKTKITDKTLEIIGKLKKLEMLNLAECQVTDAGMRSIANLPNLKHLYLSHTDVGDGGIKILKTLKLKNLCLDSNKAVNDKCLASIVNQWPYMTDLNMDDTSVTGNGLKVLPKLKSLKSLSVNTLSLGDKDMEAIYKLAALSTFHVQINYITDESLVKLATMPHLTLVDVTQCPNVTIKGIQYLKAHKIKVRALELQGNDTANEVGNLMEGY